MPVRDHRLAVVVSLVAALAAACAGALGAQPPASSTTAAAEPVPATRASSGGAFDAFPCAPDTDQDGPRELAFRGQAFSLAAPGVEFLRLRGIWWDQAQGSSQRTPQRLVTYAQRGLECPDGESTIACGDGLTQADLLAAQPVGRAPAEGALTLYFVTRTGVAVRHWRGPEALHELLGPVDTPAEAWFWLMVHAAIPGYACDAPQASGVRGVGDGYELQMVQTTSSCRPLTQERVVYHVARDGSVQVMERATLRNEPQGCVVE